MKSDNYNVPSWTTPKEVLKLIERNVLSIIGKPMTAETRINLESNLKRDFAFLAKYLESVEK